MLTLIASDMIGAGASPEVAPLFDEPPRSAVLPCIPLQQQCSVAVSSVAVSSVAVAVSSVAMTINSAQGTRNADDLLSVQSWNLLSVINSL